MSGSTGESEMTGLRKMLGRDSCAPLLVVPEKGFGHSAGRPAREVKTVMSHLQTWYGARKWGVNATPVS
jgi:hypothetical protein